MKTDTEKMLDREAEAYITIVLIAVFSFCYVLFDLSL